MNDEEAVSINSTLVVGINYVVNKHKSLKPILIQFHCHRFHLIVQLTPLTKIARPYELYILLKGTLTFVF